MIDENTYKLILLVNSNKTSNDIKDFIDGYVNFLNNTETCKILETKNYGSKNLSYTINKKFNSLVFIELIFIINCRKKINEILKFVNNDKMVIRHLLFKTSNLKSINFNLFEIDKYKKYLNETWKIIPKYLNSNTSKLQRCIEKCIKYARYLSIIPYCDNH